MATRKWNPGFLRPGTLLLWLGLGMAVLCLPGTIKKAHADPVYPLMLLSGAWATFGFDMDQTRTGQKTGFLAAGNPVLVWARELPIDRFTMFYGSTSIGEDGTLYLPFFGGGWDTGGIQAMTPEGDLKWYLKSSEVEGQTPVLVDRGGTTVVLFGNNRSLNAAFDTPECRCCVEVGAGLTPDDLPQYEYCKFDCLEDATPCETGVEGFEWRHRLYDHPDNRATPNACPSWNEACGAWAMDLTALPGVNAESYLEVSSVPLVSKDGQTVYYLVSRDNYVVAMNSDGTVKWVLGESSPGGWIGPLCPDAVNYPDDLFGPPTLLADGSFVFGTSGGCLVRIVDLGTEGKAEGVYQHKPVAPVLGLSVDLASEEIYVAAHGLTTVNEGYLYKTSKERLLTGGGVLWQYMTSRAVTNASFLDKGGTMSRPTLVKANGKSYIYAAVVDLPLGDPDRGWIVRVPADAGPGSPVMKDGRLDYPDDLIRELLIDGTWYPSYHITADGAGRLYVHGGRNRPVPGRIMSFDADLNLLWAEQTQRFGYPEVVLGEDCLVAVGHGAWFPKPIPFIPLPLDWYQAIQGKFHVVVYKYRLQEGPLPPSSGSR